VDADLRIDQRKGVGRDLARAGIEHHACVQDGDIPLIVFFRSVDLELDERLRVCGGGQGCEGDQYGGDESVVHGCFSPV